MKVPNDRKRIKDPGLRNRKTTGKKGKSLKDKWMKSFKQKQNENDIKLIKSVVNFQFHGRITLSCSTHD